MPKYKITVSKNQKKYSIVYEAETEKIAKDRVHKDGYSILSVSEFYDTKSLGKEYIFEILENNKIKKGKVIGKDLFKVYLKLREGLGYKILKLYIKADEGLNDGEKNKILKGLDDQYKIFKGFKKEKNNQNKKTKKLEKSTVEDLNIDNFYLKKELEETYKLIDFILLKLKNLIEKDLIKGIKIEKKVKLKNIYNTIIKIRNSSNIAKLKQIGEKALLKIGEIELSSLEINRTKQSKKLLTQTNQTLKKIGSDKQFVEEAKDIKKYFKKIKNKFYNFLNSFKVIKKERHKINDKSSYSYLKTLSLLDKYKEKLKENSLEIIKNIQVFIYPFGKKADKRDEILIKRSVIKQNIALLKAKSEGKIFSYTKTIKGYGKILDSIFGVFILLRSYILYTTIFYSLIFIFLLNLSHYNIFLDTNSLLNFNGIFYFLIFLFIYFAIFFSKGLLSLIFNFVILTFIIIFGIVNF